MYIVKFNEKYWSVNQFTWISHHGWQYALPISCRACCKFCHQNYPEFLQLYRNEEAKDTFSVYSGPTKKEKKFKQRNQQNYKISHRDSRRHAHVYNESVIDWTGLRIGKIPHY